MAGLHAWVDESMTVTKDDQGTYVLAAVVGDPAASTPVRQALQELLLPGQARLHWHDEKTSRRAAISAAVAKINMAAIAVVGTPVKRAKQERARRQCMEVLLPHLEELGVTTAWLESRTRGLNIADAKIVAAMRNKHLLTSRLRTEIALPLEDSMLWLPDVVAGAVRAARTGGETVWLAQISGTVTQIDITLR